MFVFIIITGKLPLADPSQMYASKTGCKEFSAIVVTYHLCALGLIDVSMPTGACCSRQAVSLVEVARWWLVAGGSRGRVGGILWGGGRGWGRVLRGAWGGWWWLLVGRWWLHGHHLRLWSHRRDCFPRGVRMLCTVAWRWYRPCSTSAGTSCRYDGSSS